MAPALAGFLADFGVALTKWGLSELKQEIEKRQEDAEAERKEGIRNGKNAQAYQAATTRAEQIRAAVNLINRND